MIVIADTGPINYLLLIRQIALLPALYDRVIIPPAVQDELLDPRAPVVVQQWIAQPPPWLEIRTPSSMIPTLAPSLGAGEREAITLVQMGGAGNLLLMDEALGRQEAKRLGLAIIGTLGVLRDAYDLGVLPDLRTAITALRATNFKAPHSLFEQILTYTSNSSTP